MLKNLFRTNKKLRTDKVPKMAEPDLFTISNFTEPIIDRFLNKIETISLFVFFILTVIGNLLVIVVLLLCKRQRTQSVNIKNVSRMSFYIIHLSVADLCVAFFSLFPEFLVRYNIYFSVESNLLCKLHKFTNVIVFVFKSDTKKNHCFIFYILFYVK